MKNKKNDKNQSFNPFRKQLEREKITINFYYEFQIYRIF